MRRLTLAAALVAASPGPTKTSAGSRWNTALRGCSPFAVYAHGALSADQDGEGLNEGDFSRPRA
jgi:hypothetical protein